MKIAVIGCGIGGLSVAWALQKRGMKVSVFDQGPIPNPGGTSFDEHRVTRHTYADLSGYSNLMPHAFATYDRLWQDLGTTHFLPLPIIYMMRGGIDWYEVTAAELEASGIWHRKLSIDELAGRYPIISTDGVERAFEAGGAGILFADRIVSDLARWLAENGTALHPESRISSIDINSGRIVVNGHAHDFDLVVVAAGAWVSDLLPEHASPLTPSRQLLLYMKPPASHAKAWADAPIITDFSPSHGAYVLPPRLGTRLKIGDHRFTRVGHGSDDRIATEADVKPVLEAAQRLFSGFDEYEIVERKVCYYTTTDDERFVAKPVGPAAWLLSACSGHGFKLAPLIGEIVASSIAGELSPNQATEMAAGRTAYLP